MPDQWHYTKNGQQHGPISPVDLKALAKSGELSPTDMVWKEGMAGWIAAGKVKGLIAVPPANAPAAPPPLSQVVDSAPMPQAEEARPPASQGILADILADKWVRIGGGTLAVIFAVTFLPAIFGWIPDGGLIFFNIVLALVFVIYVGFAAYRQNFTTPIEQLYGKGGPELPPDYPWSQEERTAPNPKHLWARIGIGVCIVLGVICLLTIVGAVFCLPFFSAAILIYVFGINRWLLHGRWNRAEGKGWIEFLSGNVIKREDGSVGSFYWLPNQTFIDFLDKGRLVESWKVLFFEHSSRLEVQDMLGKTLNFKRAKVGVYKPPTLFQKDRITHLVGPWTPITQTDEWVQFTKDGAIVFSNGSAGKYQVSGEEPNEVIDIEMVDGTRRQFKIVSLTSDQLVISEGTEATTFRRPKKNNNAASSDDTSATPAPPEESESASGAKGVLGGLFGYFLYWKCPKCKQRAGKTVRSGREGDIEQRIETRDVEAYAGDYRRSARKQVVVNYWIQRSDVKCSSCGHEWSERVAKDAVA
jgi:hypothetical protein